MDSHHFQSPYWRWANLAVCLTSVLNDRASSIMEGIDESNRARRYLTQDIFMWFSRERAGITPTPNLTVEMLCEAVRDKIVRDYGSRLSRTRKQKLSRDVYNASVRAFRRFRLSLHLVFEEEVENNASEEDESGFTAAIIEPDEPPSESGSEGMSQRELDKMPTSVIRKSDLSRECAICTQPFQRGECKAVLSCVHTFHDECIKRWLSVSRSCPMCRKDQVFM